ncbi:hypothetical protein JQU17_02275 [Ponticoccus sp. SC2-23]|uniref:DUF3592 domain-containing protein n=1 Tax=Alexandriicola marinus TaxID=2081710 RepID=UPI000FDC3EC9|nr:DUF3592 domain-containing protein [Alexandriicola marinus]MBM1219011.1 hypothetical protein [Ponticoccus sp. SC6-9]MBM1223917.1 hypothetical protein [Ponticoccus sp. SC6-15]MBM1230304.1 hypothetical protein [Ponticoccus sp. SC6-38]MBM1232883.1 hypothetical protein [Ponticoccus sp. SC6-45]MBM1237167.1 hypothetical protein [Ponticoccus sp. SC6-49]MBM1241894.1 hypothetical protein [Ponticoccus sp. SC2-64]MBM1246407.1 hypothetical protein [Ponticoccus sp. SC6-42]MBM1250885.1 hypothetical pro
MIGRGAIIQQIVNRLTRGMKWRARLLIIVFCAPVLFTLATLGFGVASAVYVLRSDVVTGTAVQVYEWEGTTPFDRGQINYEPVFTYQDAGEERRASVGSAHSSFKMVVGDTAEIRHIPGNRGNVKMNTWQGLWFMPVALAGFAAVAWVLAGLIWIVLSLLFFRKGAT